MLRLKQKRRPIFFEIDRMKIFWMNIDWNAVHCSLDNPTCKIELHRVTMLLEIHVWIRHWIQEPRFIDELLGDRTLHVNG